MKKIILTTLVALLSYNAFSQQEININDLIGYWKPNLESAHVFFWKDDSGKLLTQSICGSNGEPIDIITLRVEKNLIFIRTVYIPNEWVTENTYTFINKTTLKCVVTGDGNGILIYTKIK